MNDSLSKNYLDNCNVNELISRNEEKEVKLAQLQRELAELKENTRKEIVSVKIINLKTIKSINARQNEGNMTSLNRKMYYCFSKFNNMFIILNFCL